VPGDSIDDRILEVVFVLFLQRGYAGFSMQDVATRVGVPESRVVSLGSRPELLATAVDHCVPDLGECADTGSLRGDLRALFDLQKEHMRDNRTTIERCLKAIQEIPEFAAASRPLTHGRIEVYRPIFERAMARGELGHDLGFDELPTSCRLPSSLASWPASSRTTTRRGSRSWTSSSRGSPAGPDRWGAVRCRDETSV
jgi:AcrR family transcriptional regulator